VLPVTDERLVAFVDEVGRTQGRLLEATAMFGAAEGLSGAQLTVLAVVVNAPFSPTVPQIGRSLGHTRQAVQRLAASLASLELVEFVDNPDHKRARRLAPTEKGLALYRRVDAQSRGWTARILAAIDPDDIDAATRTLRVVRQFLQADHAAAFSAG
jgi:DNA-binding MarR family transcriptional regulator